MCDSLSFLLKNASYKYVFKKKCIIQKVLIITQCRCKYRNSFQPILLSVNDTAQ